VKNQPPAQGRRRRRSMIDQTNTKPETKIQKRTRNLDFYGLDKKICEKTISD
jgi:hypothetical protein